MKLDNEFNQQELKEIQIADESKQKQIEEMQCEMS